MSINTTEKIPARRPGVARRIDDLPFIGTIDIMLTEGAPATDVARFILEDHVALVDVSPQTLGRELARRKESLARALDASEDIEGERTDGVKSTTPSALAVEAYARAESHLSELVELEVLYFAQRARIDRMIEREAATGRGHEATSKAIAVASRILLDRVLVKEKLGLRGPYAESRCEVTDFKGYSKETAEVLSHPESRRRVISIIERVTANCKAANRMLPATAETAEQPLRPTGDPGSVTDAF